MGMLETGSIMRPRIFISMSIVPPEKPKNENRKPGPARSRGLESRLYKDAGKMPAVQNKGSTKSHQLAEQAVGAGLDHPDLDVLSQKVRAGRREIDDAVARSATGPLAGLVAAIIDEDLEGFSEQGMIAGELDLALMVEERGETNSLLRLGNVVVHVFGGSVGARGKLEAENLVVLRGVEKGESVGEIRAGFAGEADDEVGGKTDGAACGAEHSDFFEILVSRVGAEHAAENGRRAGLDGQVHVVADGWMRVDGGDDVRAEIAGVRGGKANAADAGRIGDGQEETGEGHRARRRVTIGIYGLAEELNFGIAEGGEFADFAEDGIARAAALGAARKGDDAVGTGLVASFDDGEVGAEGIVAAGDFGFEGFVRVRVETHDAAIAGFDLGEEVGKAAIAGGAADEGDPGSALEDFFAFLLGDTAEDADDFAVSGGTAVETETGKDFLRGFFADGTGVVEDDVCGGGVVHGMVAAFEEDAGNFFGVVDIHLAAEGFDVKGAAGGRRSDGAAGSAGEGFERDVQG